MTTIDTSYLVSQALQSDPVLRHGFERNLISPGALAKQIVIKNPNETINQESLRTAIRRLKKSQSKELRANTACDLLGRSYLHLRSNIVKVEFKKDESTINLINKTFKLNELYNQDLFRIIKGHSVLNAVIEEMNFDKVSNIFDGKIEDLEKDLCEFIVLLPKDGTFTPGVLMMLVDELTIADINIVQTFSCGDEINIIVKEKYSQQAYNILSNLLRRSKAELHEKEELMEKNISS